MPGKYKNKGLRLTPQRLAVLEYLDGNTSHPSAEEIHGAVKKRHPFSSLATVYNTLEALKKRGEIAEITIDPRKKHFDPNPMPHHHIICTGCNRIADIFEDYSAMLRIPGDISSEFIVTGNHVDFYGLCKRCRTRR